MADLSESPWLSLSLTHARTHTHTHTNGLFKNKLDIKYKCSMYTSVIWELEN